MEDLALQARNRLGAHESALLLESVAATIASMKKQTDELHSLSIAVSASKNIQVGGFGVRVEMVPASVPFGRRLMRLFGLA